MSFVYTVNLRPRRDSVVDVDCKMVWSLDHEDSAKIKMSIENIKTFDHGQLKYDP